jgi:hypothetical protein
MGSYIPWDVKRQVALIEKELGWKGDVMEGVAPGYPYEKIECGVQGVRDYLKFIKRGYGRTTHLASIDIRNDRLDRGEGLDLALEHDGKRPASLDMFLDYTGISEDEFDKIAESHTVAPYKHDTEATRRGDPLPDQDRWDKNAPFPKTPLSPPTDDA